jgi:hypothetical protein
MLFWGPTLHNKKIFKQKKNIAKKKMRLLTKKRDKKKRNVYTFCFEKKHVVSE